MSTSSPSRERRLSSVFVSLADSLVTGYDVVDLMQQLVDTCVELLGCDAAGLMLADSQGHLRVMASSSDAVRTLELYELQNLDGPCLESFRQGRPVGAQSLSAADSRWPNFAPVARAAGFSSVQALPMRLRDTTIGALNLFLRASNLLSDDSRALAQALADVATISVLQQRATAQHELLTEQLQRALTNRLVIEQAKGVLAERGQLGMAEAFETLRAFSRRNRLAVSSVAAEVVSGELETALLLHPDPAAQ